MSFKFKPMKFRAWLDANEDIESVEAERCPRCYHLGCCQGSAVKGEDCALVRLYMNQVAIERRNAERAGLIPSSTDSPAPVAETCMVQAEAQSEATDQSSSSSAGAGE